MKTGRGGEGFGGGVYEEFHAVSGVQCGCLRRGGRGDFLWECLGVSG
jgi:hypothetical protein